MHIRNIHEGERRFECKLCNKTFTQLVVLKSHEQSSIHNKNKIFKCESCQKKFTKKVSLHSHEKRMHQTNNEKEFHCKYCNKKVKSIKMHIRAVHDLTKKVSCEICGYSSLKADYCRNSFSSATKTAIFGLFFTRNVKMWRF